MKVWVDSARSSFGNTKPGDQNGGREVSREKYYVHSKGYNHSTYYVNQFYL